MKPFESLRIAFAVAILAISIATPGHAAGADDAIYRALGNTPGIERIVDDLLDRVLADGRINASFKDVDIPKLKQKLVDQLCELAGGPCKYRGKEMRLIHEDLAITNAHFNALTEHLQLAMERNNVPSGMQNRLIAKLAPMQRDIVTK